MGNDTKDDPVRRRNPAIASRPGSLNEYRRYNEWYSQLKVKGRYCALLN